jgi:hypothetical protein
VTTFGNNPLRDEIFLWVDFHYGSIDFTLKVAIKRQEEGSRQAEKGLLIAIRI